MSHPSVHARTDPEKAALIVAETGETVSFAELDARSNRAAQLFRACGLMVGDTIALCLENTPEFYDAAWGAQRAGLFFVCVSTKLTTPEIAYILSDSGAKLLVASASLAGVVAGAGGDLQRFAVGGSIPGWASWADAIAAMPPEPIADERAGIDMLYSSGTTGRPKGVRVALPADPDIAGGTVLEMLARGLYGLGADSIYLSPAPLYHAAPLRWSMTVQRLGGTVVIMEHFVPEAALAAIERYTINASQWVPTHFVRMLKLSEEARERHDLSSLKVAIHAAAPCPVPVKQAMIDWWGPVLYEYYAGSEGNGLTTINSTEWLAHKGSVGKAAYGLLHICGEDGAELSPGAEGLVYFEGGTPFEYHNDPAKTAEARNALGWTTLGDIGRVDEDGYLTLTDRKSFMIISGGVNIYPQEIENRLITHPRVADVAVIGAPCAEMGEQVVAVVQPIDMAEAGEELAAELTAWCRVELSGVKTPRRIDFTAELPRHATGKLYKRLLRDQYWAQAPVTPAEAGAAGL
jgi:fatty-acyl-CoA synthase